MIFGSGIYCRPTVHFCRGDVDDTTYSTFPACLKKCNGSHRVYARIFDSVRKRRCHRRWASEVDHNFRSVNELPKQLRVIDLSIQSMNTLRRKGKAEGGRA